MELGESYIQIGKSSEGIVFNVITDEKMLASSLTAGQVIKAVSSLLGPEIVLCAVRWAGGIVGGIVVTACCAAYLLFCSYAIRQN